MNAIEENDFTRGWQAMAGIIPKPAAILVLSAHWFVRGIRLLNDLRPKMTYDLYGFPQALYQVVYEAPGSPAFADMTSDLLSQAGIGSVVDNSWGYDHGTWSVLNHMYPERDVPVFQMSIDRTAPPETHFAIGKILSGLREAGVLILGSGNIVHNLNLIDWYKPEGGFDWADAFDLLVHEQILKKNFDQLVHYPTIGRSADLSIPTPDHYWPLLYILGACQENDTATVFNDSRIMGSLSMTSYLFSAP